jgi:hypothetical protein
MATGKMVEADVKDDQAETADQAGAYPPGQASQAGQPETGQRIYLVTSDGRERGVADASGGIAGMPGGRGMAG